MHAWLQDIWVRDCLNLGVHPRSLLDMLRRKFVGAGGVIYENTAFKGAAIHTVRLRAPACSLHQAQCSAVQCTTRGAREVHPCMTHAHTDLGTDPSATAATPGAPA